MNAIRFLLALNFAAEKHRHQRRKDKAASPYINHPIAVATVLAVEGGVDDEDLLLAGLLHDTVEDTETTFDELMDHFGEAVTGLVREVTDDKDLTKELRKQLQIEHAHGSSALAKQLKLADKICNIRDVTEHPPHHWPLERRLEYLTWADRVAAGCRGVNAGLEQAFDGAVARAREVLK